MKEQDVRIGMKVKLNGTGDDCVILSEKDYRNLNKAFETLQELAEKDRDAIEEFAKKTEKERLEEEIQKSFKLHVKKHGTDFSLFSCYKAGYIAGREGK